MAIDADTQSKIDGLTEQKNQLQAQYNEYEDLLERLDATREKAANDEEWQSISNQYIAAAEKQNNIKKIIDGISSQIVDLRNQATSQPSPASETDKNSAAGNTTSESTPQTNKQELSSTETKNIEKADTAVSTEDKSGQINDAPPVSATQQSTDDEGTVSSVLAPETPKIDPLAKVEPVPNPLHAYPSYTYNFSLHVLTPSAWNNLNKNGMKGFSPSKTLIAGASRYHEKRLKTFEDDFYIDNFKMTTVIGLNSATQGTNGIDISFTIIEPYGLTLLNRLVDLNTKDLECQNYLELPYLFEIKFFGYDDQGRIANLEEHTKLIPIRILDMKISAGVRGAEYQVRAMPFSHSALMESTQASPANFEVTAKSVAEFFAPNKLSATQQQQITTAYKDSNRNYNKSQANAVPGKNAAESAKPRKAGGGAIATVKRKSSSDVRETTSSTSQNAEQAPVSPPPSLNITSYTSAYNAWQDQARENKNLMFPDYIYFKFDRPMVENNKIVYDKKNPASKTATQDPSIKNDNSKAVANDPNSQSKTPATGPDFTRSIFNINAGTSIVALLNQVLQNSDFILNQINEPGTVVNGQQADNAVESKSSFEQTKEEAINWFKIIPVIELGPYDEKRNRYQRITTFYVKDYSYHNSKDNRANQSFPNGYVKDYEYIYTGKNQDIFEFEIDFNTLYYTAVQSDLAKNEAIGAQPQDDSNKAVSGIGKDASNGVTPITKVVVSDTAGSSMMNAGSDAKKKQANLVSESFYSTPRGDMLNLKIKILGDPQFIKQDDVICNPAQPGYDVSKTLSPTTNSLVMDAGELYCFVRFKTPVDIDETTGLLRTNGDYVESVFSGYYKIMTVESEFINGKFTQLLSLIRQFNQPQDNKTGSGSPAGNRNAAENRLSDEKLKDKMTSASNPGVQDNNVADSGTRTSELTEKSTGVITTPTSVTKNTSSSSTVASVTGGGVTEKSIEMTPWGTVKENSYKETYKPDSAGPTAADIKDALGNDTGDGTMRDDSNNNAGLRNVAKNGPVVGQDF